MSKKKHHREQPQEQAGKAEAAAAEEQLAAARAEIEELRAELEEMRDKYLRAHAEMDNVRKRAQREMEKASQFAIERFAAALLDVFDNLERALEVEEGKEAALRAGVQLTLKSWHELMRKFGMERIDAAGKKFDPHLHEALAQVPHAEEEAGKVVAQHVAGYTLHGRLLRPAKVIVSSGAPPAAGETAARHAHKAREEEEK